jgi:hypothetical protein
VWALRRAQLSVECGTVQQSGRGVWFSFCCVGGAVRDVVLVLCRHVYDRELITGLLSVRLKYCQGHGTCCLKSRVAHGDRDSKEYQHGGCVGAAPSSKASHPRLWVCSCEHDELSPCSWAGGVYGGREIRRGLCLGRRS